MMSMTRKRAGVAPPARRDFLGLGYDAAGSEGAIAGLGLKPWRRTAEEDHVDATGLRDLPDVGPEPEGAVRGAPERELDGAIREGRGRVAADG